MLLDYYIGIFFKTPTSGNASLNILPSSINPPANPPVSTGTTQLIRFSLVVNVSAGVVINNIPAELKKP